MDTDVVILAAGRSKRMNLWKMEMEFNGKKMIDIVIEKFEDFCNNIIVVGGYRFDRLKEILMGKNVKLVKNERFEEGMFISLKKGVRFVKGNRFFIIPGDVPFVKKETLLNMTKLNDDIIVPFYNGKGGHPVLIKSDLIDDLLKQDDNSSLKEFINKKGFKRFDVDDENILIDVDTKEDYERYKNLY